VNTALIRSVIAAGAQTDDGAGEKSADLRDASTLRAAPSSPDRCQHLTRCADDDCVSIAPPATSSPDWSGTTPLRVDYQTAPAPSSPDRIDAVAATLRRHVALGYQGAAEVAVAALDAYDREHWPETVDRAWEFMPEDETVAPARAATKARIEADLRERIAADLTGRGFYAAAEHVRGGAS
jgi:hypothetical protein